ncbi:MAG: PD40 domain-containing protein [Crocinitomicaceae bacterium]|nr:PD40 domain-containing protein [Crocinitomicaceae bacterium]
MKKSIVLSVIMVAVSMASNAQFWDFSTPTQLKGTVNAETSEEGIPIFSNDSSMLYFVRTFDEKNTGDEFDQDIWASIRQDGGGYSESTRISGLNNKFNNAVVGMSSDGTSLFLLNAYDGKKDQKKGIAVSKKKNNSWSTPEPIDIPGLYIDGDFYGFHVNEKEDVILISYMGENSLGKEDLYICTKSGGTWSEPLHMGDDINSTGFEISPFLSKDQDTLFFSSDGFGGAGDADIFYSVKQGSWTDWSKPVNLGNEINSPKFDAHFSYSGKYAYWSSNRDRELSDIYMIEIFTPPPLKIGCSAVAASTNKGADGSIDLTIESGAAPYTFEWSNGASTEDILALSKGKYTVTVTDAVGHVNATTCYVDEPTIPVLAYENYKFKHNFGYNKSKLSVSKGDLKKFVNAVEKDFEEGRASVTIKIVSSASQVPTKTFGTNEELAKVRAENIKKVLMKYFKNKYADKVTVVIEKAIVDGPSYVDDSVNKSKYVPFQFVELVTE